MSNFHEKIKKFMSGDYETFEELQLEEKKKNLSVCIKSFKEKLTAALAAMKTARNESIVALEEGYTVLSDMTKYSDSKKLPKLIESYKNTKLLLQLDCNDTNIDKCKNTLEIIKENIENEFIDMSQDDIEPVVENKEIHDPIPDLEQPTINEIPDATTEPTETGLIDQPENQHEESAKSAYSEGFEKGRKLWERGINAKHIAEQLAETELSESPYGYVTRFQEGLIAGCAFQEQVERDLNPDSFETDDK